MAMNSTQFKGVIVDRNKKDIIEKYNRGIKINILADKYNVGVDTLCRRLRSWGVKVRKGDYRRKIKTKKHWYRKFSKEFLANRVEITKMNNDRIKCSSGVNKTSDQKLIRNILNRAFI